MTIRPHNPNRARFIAAAALTTTALLASLALSACGKLGTLEQAPPMMNKSAELSWSTSQNSDGGTTTTTDDSRSADTERAKPDKDDVNHMPDPYRGNKKISSAPLEGFGNAEGQ
ncbi:hypothetical protein [Asticcacaulis sp. EMRT-3]|uniref:hypothetical protein n=1 Tax=Asticcacaulis sp. EMRT-3 TaxID=3040349 RepID=UPI0024AFB2D7|nr:hypothetical protein [Asticcacaulis sp. EMRT-3]MDI7776047.1 hypothetical protein [Asticcacaulis sp. EMRT-3]